MKRFVILIGLLFLISIGSAAIISSSSVNIAVGNTGTSTILLNTAPNGLAGCNITVAVANTSVATISGISFDTWASPHADSGTPANSVTFTEADFGNVKVAGATNIVLAYITVHGLATGSTTLQVTINACDDDLCGVIGPSASNGTIGVTPPSTLPPGGNAGPYQIPDVPFPAVNTAGIHMLSATVNSATKTVTFIGQVDNTTKDPEAWFILGDPPGVYSYFTVAYPANASGYVTIPFGTGSPLYPGEIFYVRMASHNGRSVEEVTFTTPSLTALPTSNFSQYFYNIQYSNHSPLTMLAAIPLPLVDLFGAGNAKFGWMIFYTIMFGIICVVLVVRQDSIVLVFDGVCMASGLILYLIDPEFIWIIYAFCAIAAATILYRLYRRE